MVSIEHNPTHTQTEARPGEPGEIRLDGVTRKKGRKSADSLGVFGKLLAGLTGKKAMPGTAGRPSLEGTPGLEDIPGSPGSAGIPAGKKDKALRLGAKGAEGGDAIPDFPRQGRRKGPGEAADPGTEVPAFFTPARPVEKTPENAGALPGFTEGAPGEDAGAGEFTLAGGGRYPGGITGREERPLPFRRDSPAESVPPEGQIRNAALRPAAGKEDAEGKVQGENRSEGRKAEKRRDRFSLDVRDLRTVSGAETAAASSPGTEEFRPGDGGLPDIVLELRGPGGRDPSGGHPGTFTAEESAAHSFEQLLARELRGDLSADIVKQAAVVLRDGGEGTIRLSLRPESLGKVKIRLEMAENKISGHIVVESEEALRAFEREIHTLEQSFRDSGFEASLSAALDYRNGGQQWKEEEANPFFSERLAAAGYEEKSGGLPALPGRPDDGLYAVNVLA